MQQQKNQRSTTILSYVKHCLNFPEINTFCPPPHYKWDKRKKVINNNSTEYLKIIPSSVKP